MLNEMMWIAAGFCGWLIIADLFNRHFGRMEEKYVIIPCLFFSLLGGLTLVLAMLIHMSLEWDGKLTLIERIIDMFTPKSYASITSGLAKMVTDLESHVETQEAGNAADEAKKVEIDKAIAGRNEEIAKSQKTAGKIRDLIEI